VLSNLKGNPRTRAIPVIMLTSIPSYETEAECLRLGASNVLTKPCNFEDVATHIRVALREGQETVEEEPSGEVLQDQAEWELPTEEVLPDAQPALKSPGQSSKFVSAGGRPGSFASGSVWGACRRKSNLDRRSFGLR